MADDQGKETKPATTATPTADGQPAGQQSPDKGQPSYVTQDFLKAWSDANSRKTKEMLDQLAQQQAALQAEIAKLAEAAKPQESEQDAKAKKAQAVPELIDLRKALEGSSKKNAELEKTIADMQNRERNYRFSTIVKEALNRQGCLKTEDAFRIIRDDLKLDADGSRVFATVDLEGTQVELDVDKYVETVVKEKRVPEFFSGNHRPGSPASGGGVAGKDFDFTMDQIRDSEFYAANADKIREALSKGRVKMTK